MKRRWLLLFTALGFLSALLIPASQSAAQQVINLRFSNFFPAPHKNSIIADQWCKEVEKRTNGRVKIAYYPAGTLTPPVQTYDSVVKGIADIGESVLGFTRGKFPLTEVIDLPLGARTAYVATKMINAYYGKFKPKEFDETKVLYLHCYGPALIWTKNKQVRNLEELKGLKIRSHGLSAKVVQALGAIPVGMPMNETYDSISRGVAEGVMCPTEAMKGWKLADVCNYGVESYSAAQSAGFFVVMNKAKWNTLPPDIQKTIETINEEWIEKQGKLWDEIDKEGREVFVQAGKKMVPLTAEESTRWAARVRPILDDYLKEMKAKGLPGEDALKFCQDYLKANQK